MQANPISWIDSIINGILDVVAHWMGLRDDVSKDFDLLEDEEILHVTYRHWGRFIFNLLMLLLVVSLFAAMAFYRAIGGQILVTPDGGLAEMPLTEIGEDGAGFLGGPVIPFDLDPTNQFLVLMLGVLLIWWVVGYLRRSSQGLWRWWPIVASFVLIIIVYYRLRGGQILSIDPAMARPFDLINIGLFTVVILGLLSAGYIFVDWANDQLILTTQRVIKDDELVIIPGLIERRTQEQVSIEEIQNVVTSTDTYLKHWFNYGNITVRTAVANRKIFFPAARDPQAMQSKISDEVKKLQKQQSERNFSEMIETKVYNQPPKEKRKFTFNRDTINAPLFLRSFLEPNPKFDEEKGVLTWHPHWLFLIQALAVRPLTAAAVAFIVLAIFASLGVVSASWSVIIAVVLLIGLVAWVIWEVEDHRNDRYILTPTNAIDIDKRPLGPEKRNTASLGALLNVSYTTTFLGNLIGYGDVLLETAGSGEKFTFVRVPNPRDVVATVNDYILQFKAGEKERSLNDSLTLLRHYHEAQQRHQEIATPVQPSQTPPPRM